MFGLLLAYIFRVVLYQCITLYLLHTLTNVNSVVPYVIAGLFVRIRTFVLCSELINRMFVLRSLYSSDVR